MTYIEDDEVHTEPNYGLSLKIKENLLVRECSSSYLWIERHCPATKICPS
jgi:hypothetical protein